MGDGCRFCGRYVIVRWKISPRGSETRTMDLVLDGGENRTKRGTFNNEGAGAQKSCKKEARGRTTGDEKLIDKVSHQSWGVWHQERRDRHQYCHIWKRMKKWEMADLAGGASHGRERENIVIPRFAPLPTTHNHLRFNVMPRADVSTRPRHVPSSLLSTLSNTVLLLS